VSSFSATSGPESLKVSLETSRSRFPSICAYSRLQQRIQSGCGSGALRFRSKEEFLIVAIAVMPIQELNRRVGTADGLGAVLVFTAGANLIP
jgi:hypothetical protein